MRVTQTTVGDTFGYLTVVAVAPGLARPGWPRIRPRANVQCICGRVYEIEVRNLQTGTSRSCGCQRSMLMSKARLVHGESSPTHRTPEYRAWMSMKNRATNPRRREWKYYGGRGIAVCDEWMRSFTAFLRDMGRRPPGLELDRIDNNGNYEPGNCRWTDRKTQLANRRPYAKKGSTK